LLSTEGLVTRAGGRGFSIRQFHMGEIQDIYDFRDLLEGAIIPWIARRVTDAQIEKIARILQQAKELIKKKKNPGEIQVKSFEFHAALNEICQNPLVIEALRSCYEKISLISWYAQTLDISVQSLKEHEEVLASLRERDASKLHNKIHGHNARACQRTMDILMGNRENWFLRH
jgi:DNA-binding GntR family transcriptional regulator